MSELTKFVKKVEEVSKKWTSLNHEIAKEIPDSVLTDCISKFISEHEKLEKEILDDLQPTAEKLVTKLNQIDPVTGERRYGLQSVQKFSVAHESLNKLVSETTITLAALRKQHEEYLSQHIIAEPSIDVVDTASAEEEERRKKEEEENRIAQEEAAEAERKRLEEAALLHEQAEKIRKRKHQEQEQCKEVENKVCSRACNNIDQQS